MIAQRISGWNLLLPITGQIIGRNVLIGKIQERTTLPFSVGAGVVSLLPSLIPLVVQGGIFEVMERRGEASCRDLWKQCPANVVVGRPSIITIDMVG